MIARVFAAAHVTVHAGCGEALRQWRTEQQMVDAQTGVATESVPEILPESVDPLAGAQGPQRVGSLRALSNSLVLLSSSGGMRFYLKTPLFSILTVKPCASGDWPHPETVSAWHQVTKVEGGGLTGKPQSEKDVMLH